MVGITRDRQKCPFKLACEHCLLELTLFVPDNHTVKEYTQITEPFLTTHLKSIIKQDDNAYTLTAYNGETLKNVKFTLTYLCGLAVEPNRSQPIQPPQLTLNHCSNYKNIDENELTIRTFIYKKPSANQEVKIQSKNLILPSSTTSFV